MSTPYLGEIKIISWNFPEKGWAFCNGQLLPINQNQALFSILGTTYGGNGQTNFGLPNLQGRVPIHMGNGFTLGQMGGERTHTLLVTELPAHTHLVAATKAAAAFPSPSGKVWAAQNSAYGPTGTGPDVVMNPGCIPNAGGFQAHENMSPFLTLNFMIALQGIFPTP